MFELLGAMHHSSVTVCVCIVYVYCVCIRMRNTGFVIKLEETSSEDDDSVRKQ